MGGLPFMFGKKKFDTRTRLENVYKQKEDGVSETGYDDGRSGYLDRRKNTGMKYAVTVKADIRNSLRCLIRLRKAALILCLALFINTLVWSGQRMLLQRGIADEVLRFHVLANSDSEEDQTVKLEVRDAVLAWLEEAWKENEATQEKKETTNTRTENGSEKLQENQGKAKTLETFKDNQQEENTSELSFTSDLESEKNRNENQKEKEAEFLRAHLTDLQAVANNVLVSRDLPYQAHAELTTCYFPSRTYGTCTFPPGWYEALRIKLGKAKGHNWWCVLYPRLCFTGSLHAVVEEEEMQQLSNVLTEAEYDSLLHEPSRWKLTFRWF